MTNPVKKPSIRRKFLYILVSSTILLVGLVFIFDAVIVSKNNSLLTERLQEAKTYTDAHFQDNTSTQKNYVFDNSYWDGLIDYYKTKDSAWIYDNFLLGLSKYNIDYIWFLDSKLNTVKSYDAGAKKEIDDFEIERTSELAAKLRKSPFSHFFTKAHGELIEV